MSISPNRYASLIESLIPDALPAPPLAPPGTRLIHRQLILYSQLMAGIDARDSIVTLDSSILSMLTLQVAGEMFNQPESITRATGAFNHLIDHQQPTGEFLLPDSSMNPESRWYEELITLHALTSYTARVRSPKANSAVQRSAEFHLQQTQPDHATAEPWALLAFIQFAPPLADQILHAMQMQYPQGITGIPLLLLQDALYGLQRTMDN